MNDDHLDVFAERLCVRWWEMGIDVERCEITEFGICVCVSKRIQERKQKHFCPQASEASSKSACECSNEEIM